MNVISPAADPVVLHDDPDDESLAHALESTILSVGDVDSRAIEFVSGLSRYLLSDALARGEREITICDVYRTPNAAFFEAHPNCPLRYDGDVDLMAPNAAALRNQLCEYADAAWKALFARQVPGIYINAISGLFDLYVEAGGPRQSPGVARWMAHRKFYVAMVAQACFRICPDYMTAREQIRSVTLADLSELSSPDGFLINEIEQQVLPQALRHRVAYYLDHVARMSGCAPFHTDEARAADIAPPQAAMDFHASILSGVRAVSAVKII